MVSPTSRRSAVELVRHEHPDVSVRRTCELFGLSRNALKTPTHKIDIDAPLVAARSINAKEVCRLLTELFKRHGVPRKLRTDNGAEFAAAVTRALLNALGVEHLAIAPGSPWQNGVCESFNGKLRDECLDREVFYDLREARVVIEDFRRWFDTVRSHSSLGYRTPAAFAAGCAPRCRTASMDAEQQDLIEREDAAPLPSQTLPSTPPRPLQVTSVIQSSTVTHAGS